jgi:succinyl-CoA synthetase beta subunit
VKVGNLAFDRSEEIEALDINPLLIMPEGEGVIAVDALLVTGT